MSGSLSAYRYKHLGRRSCLSFLGGKHMTVRNPFVPGDRVVITWQDIVGSVVLAACCYIIITLVFLF